MIQFVLSEQLGAINDGVTVELYAFPTDQDAKQYALSLGHRPGAPNRVFEPIVTPLYWCPGCDGAFGPTPNFPGKYHGRMLMVRCTRARPAEEE